MLEWNVLMRDTNEADTIRRSESRARTYIIKGAIVRSVKREIKDNEFAR